jgi:chromosome segregation ATPase
MQAPTDCLTLQNADVARSIKKKSAKPRQHRPYKSVSAASLETRIADIKKKVAAWESKMEALREKLKQHNQELSLREVSAPA